ASITPDLSAGYFIGFQDYSTNPIARSGSNAMDQNSGSFGTGLGVNFSYAYLESKTLGKVTVGFQPPAAKGAAMFTDESGTMLFDNYTFFAGFPQFYVRNNGALDTSMTWGNLAFCHWQNLPIGGDCSGIAMNSVRYDSPVIGGFSAQASWGVDDAWQVATRYSGPHQGFKVSLGLGYSVSTSETTTGPVVLERKNSSYLQAGGYVEHLASGLFVHAAYGEEDNNNQRLLGSGLPVEDGRHWYVKSGIRKNWTPLGATIVYGDYAEYLDQLGPAAIEQGATSSKMQRFGGGIAQEIDAAAMTLYMKYERYEGEVKGIATLTDIDALDLVSMGAVINF
ncbi:MAG: porin, partial [Thermomicrobiales bacterium]